ncbi:Acylpyruvase fahd1, mitochondrial [Dimargaris verticillata]|uniref:Acylpyruvase fahd1, mitochondrial n=1 Tax=Dimargaris verticillata TaxID=2761393 RepID=A0A9W8B5P1_9FUNG|nr:Acylpyruvase fahd1, mitochondrial [Dimargaris verticillata]
MQETVRQQGLPWSAAKGFDTFTPVGPFIDKSLVPNPHNVRLWCTVDGVTKQDGTTSDLIFQIPRLLSDVSQVMTLEPGDLVLTDTPQGVGPVLPGQVIKAGLTTKDASGHEMVLSELAHHVVARVGQ